MGELLPPPPPPAFPPLGGQMPTQGKKTADGGKMARRKKKKLKHRMNEKTYTDKTNVSSEADLTSDEETTITKTSNQNTESSAT